MKIRTDYVSNSSSSSFVVVLPKDYEFKKFIKDVARGCVANPDWDGYTKEEIGRIKEQNIRSKIIPLLMVLAALVCLCV